MDKSFTARPLVEVNPQNPPKVYAPQSVVVKGAGADGLLFNVDIGRICYLEREKNTARHYRGKHYIAALVFTDSLSSERITWLRNYLDTIFRKGWRNETLRGRLHYLRYFFHFCDFNGGSKPVTLEGLVREYQRYQIVLDQRGRMNSESSLGSTNINGRLTSARSFIQWAFELSSNDILALIPKHRNRKSKVEAEVRSVSLQEGQDYLRVCAIYFNQFADAILENNYPIKVTPPNSSNSNLYWHSARGTSLKSLPNCFNKDGDPLPYEDIKYVLAENFKSKFHDKGTFYDRTLVRNRKDWKGGKLMIQKVYSYNLSAFCFFQIYLGFTAANVQPTLDLKISDIDLSKIGFSAFAKKHKFRAGRAVKFTAPSHLKREILKYLKLRAWAESLGLVGDVDEYLFVKISEANKLKRLERSSASSLIKKSPLFEGITKISSREIRQLAGEYFIRKAQGKVSLVAKKLNNSVATTARSYTAIDIETQAQEMYRFHEELGIQVRQFNRTTEKPIPVKLVGEGDSERVATGSCTNIKGDIPVRAKGFSSEAPEPACGTFESCLFCAHFAVHTDFEDMHKLLSLREALRATSMIRNDPEHHEAVVQPALFRIGEIVEFVSKRDETVRKVISKAEEELEMGNYNKHWSRQIQILTRRANSLGGGL